MIFAPHGVRFTLTEFVVLCVATAIVAITGAAALQDTRGKADDRVCMHHLQRLGAALDLYCKDHKGYLPLSLTKEGLWMDLLDPYTGTTRDQRMKYDTCTPYHCPTALGAHPGFHRTNGNTFGINGFTVGRQDYIAEAEDWLEMDVVRQFRRDGLQHPDQLAAFGDGHWNERRTDAIQKIGSGSWTYSIETHAWAFPERVHDGGVNFVFYDGHVEHVTDIPLKMRTPFWWPTGNRE